MLSLVTGGAGFIGSHLVDLLLEKGHHIRVLDNLCCGRPSNIPQHPYIELIQQDIRDQKAIEACFNGVDYVFHLAALADIVPSIEKAQAYYETNVTGTFNILECARKYEIKKLVYAASSSCYGIPKEYPTQESAEIKPQYPYALTKRLGEELVLHWGKVYGLPVLSLRLFNVYGPRAKTSGTYGAVFGVFLAQKLKGLPFTVVGDGEQTRDFTYVTDVANAFYKAAISDVEGEIFNVGSGGTYSVNELVRLLGGEAVQIPKRPGEPDCTFADIQKIRRMLHWEPLVRFEEGVGHVLKNIDYWKEAPVWTPELIEGATKDWFRHLRFE